MTTLKHTPWRISHRGAGVLKRTFVLDNIGGKIAMVMRGYGPGDVEAYKEQQRNATVLAAAPELLETIKKIIVEIETTPSELNEALLGLIKIELNRVIRKAETA